MRLNGDSGPVLVMAPHTDDGEIGCGGLISYCVELGLDVHYVAFSSARISLAEGMAPDTLVKEAEKATSVLGIPGENLTIYEFSTRYFPSERQDILETMIELRGRINPSLILTPSVNDIHQDHAVIAHETVRAFKRQSILSYEEPWNNLTFRSDCLVRLDERHISAKVEALRCYKSQMGRSYFSEEGVRGLAAMRGAQLEGGYAEAFEVVRWML